MDCTYTTYRSLLNATYFAQTQTVALTFFGIIAGVSMRFFHRYKVRTTVVQRYPYSAEQPLLLSTSSSLAFVFVWCKYTIHKSLRRNLH